MRQPSALDELETIFTYIADRNLPAAERIYAAIEACAERLPDQPYLYRPSRIAGTREAVVHPNYILIYRVGFDAVEIVNVVHARRVFP